MNLLFIHHDPEAQPEIDDFMHSDHDDCYYSRNTEDAIKILSEHPIDLVVLVIRYMRDTAILKYINDNFSDLEVLLMASEEFDEIISLFSDRHYTVVRLPLKLKNLRTNINNLMWEGPDDKPGNSSPDLIPGT